MSPCPFCGANGDRLTELWESLDVDLWAAKVHCTACGCMWPSESAESAGDALRTAGRSGSGAIARRP